MNLYLILCFDLYTGKQDFCFYGKGYTENEAIQNAKIPERYEANDVFLECPIDEIPEEWKADKDFMNHLEYVLEHGYSNEKEGMQDGCMEA